MKTPVLLTMIVLCGYAAFSQQPAAPGNDPGMVLPRHGKFPVERDNASIIPAALHKPAAVTENHLPGSSRPSSFDPLWAYRFQTVLDSVFLASGVKGLSAAVLVPGMGIWTGASGQSGTGIPMNTHQRFGIASNTKLFIAVTLAKLQQQGILSLDDHLYQWLPSYPNVDSSATIRQLLSHQSGIFDFWNDNASAYWNMILADTSHHFTPQEVLATIGPPHFSPGHGYRYSNTGYLLAGMIIEAATGQNYTLNLHDVIFDPLVMDSTFVGAIESRNGPVAHEWVWSLGEVSQSPMTSAYTALNSAGNILSTAAEMAEWYSALFNGDVLSAPDLAEILDIEPTSSYGLGLFKDNLTGHTCYEHSGAQVGDLSQMLYDIQTKSVFCIMTNSRQNVNFGNILWPMLNVLWNEYPRKPHDAGITKILTPWENYCSPLVSPVVTLRNFANQTMTSAAINYKVDNGTVASYSWTGLLGPDATTNVALPMILADSGVHSFTCYTSSPNGNPDGYNYNDTAVSSFIVNASAQATAPLAESFDGPVFPPPGWSQNSSAVYCWGRTTLASFSGTGSAVRPNYWDGMEGTWDLNLPLIDIGDLRNTSLGFTYAYAPYPGYSDSLVVAISDDCGATWHMLFGKVGYGLATASATTELFYPHNSSQWKSEVFSLSEFTGNVLIRFHVVNGNGNNLYLDNVNLTFPAGTPDKRPPEEYLVFPVPASSEINITGLPLHTEVRITDLTGKLMMKQETVNSNMILDIRKFSRGVYILKSCLGVKKIVKM